MASTFQIEMSDIFKKPIKKESTINIILVGEKGARKTEFMNILIGNKMNEDNNKKINLIKIPNYSLFFFDTIAFQINELGKSLTIDSELINFFTTKKKQNKMNYLVLFFLKDKYKRNKVLKFFEIINYESFSYIFIVDTAQPSQSTEDISYNLFAFLDSDKLVGVHFVDIQNQRGIKQVLNDIIKYFEPFRIRIKSKYITYHNRYIFNKDKSYTQNELNIRIICAFCDTIISILNDIDNEINYNC